MKNISPVYLLLLLLTGSLPVTWAQTSGVQWEKTFGGSEDEVAVAARSTRDGGYVLGGYSYSEPSGNKTSPSFDAGDFWVVKLNSAGERQWDKSVGGAEFDGIRNLQQTADGGYILVGISFSGATGNKNSPSYGPKSGDYWVVKLNASGDKQWDQTFGGTAIDTATCVQQTSDGGFIVGGNSLSGASGNKTSGNYGSGSSDFWIVKLDANGNKQWERVHGGTDDDELACIEMAPGGGFILAGTSFSGTTGNKTAANRGQRSGDYWLLKLDASGNKQWEQTYGGNDAEELHSALPTIDGGYLLGGTSTSGASGNKTSGNQGSHDYWIVKIDAAGNRLWDRTHGGEDSDLLYSVRAASDGGFLLGGVSLSTLSGNKGAVSFGSESGDYWIVKTDSNGNKQTEQSIRGSLDGEIARLEESADGGFLLPGAAAIAGGLDFSLAKLGGPLRFLSSAYGSGRVFHTQLAGMPGSNYVLQTSGNLMSWTSIATNRALNGMVTFRHTNSVSTARLFYRVQQQ
jgi:hypothetical protein